MVFWMGSGVSGTLDNATSLSCTDKHIGQGSAKQKHEVVCNCNKISVLYVADCTRLVANLRASVKSM